MQVLKYQSFFVLLCTQDSPEATTYTKRTNRDTIIGQYRRSVLMICFQKIWSSRRRRLENYGRFYLIKQLTWKAILLHGICYFANPGFG